MFSAARPPFSSPDISLADLLPVNTAVSYRDVIRCVRYNSWISTKPDYCMFQKEAKNYHDMTGEGSGLWRLKTPQFERRK